MASLPPQSPLEPQRSNKMIKRKRLKELLSEKDVDDIYKHCHKLNPENPWNLSEDELSDLAEQVGLETGPILTWINLQKNRVAYQERHRQNGVIGFTITCSKKVYKGVGSAIQSVISIFTAWVNPTLVALIAYEARLVFEIALESRTNIFNALNDYHRSTEYAGRLQDFRVNHQRVPWHINKALLNLIGSTNKNVYEFFGHEPVILCPLCWSWYDFLIPLLVWSAWGYFFAGVFMAMMEIARPGQTRWSKWGPRLLLVFWMIDVSMVVLALPLSQEPSPKVDIVYQDRIRWFRRLALGILPAVMYFLK